MSLRKLELVLTQIPVGLMDEQKVYAVCRTLAVIPLQGELDQILTDMHRQLDRDTLSTAERYTIAVDELEKGLGPAPGTEGNRHD